MPDKDIRPADGGSYRKTKDGQYERLDKPQSPASGKSKTRVATPKNVRDIRGKKED